MNHKIAIVTGGNRGLGKEMAISLAKKSIDVISKNTNGFFMMAEGSQIDW